jgi:hypothetical protein
VSRSTKQLLRRRVLTLSLLFCISTGFTLVPGLRAQEPAAQPSTQASGSGWVWVEQFAGSGTNGAGQVISLTSTAGYNFTSHFGLIAGLPVYFVRDSASTTGSTSSDGIGDVFAGLRFSFPNPVVNFRTALTATAPTGDTSKGLSVGHGTVDWTNRFERRFRRWIPFANLGLANSVPDTLFYQRQYTSYGYVAHFQVGTSFRIMRSLGAVASAYDMEPWGSQAATSRIVVDDVEVPGPLGSFPACPFLSRAM